jgi:hypothetical protein
MERQFEIKGYWWLPEDENNKLAGLLYMSNDGEHYLELFGTFEDTPFLTKRTEFETINGVSSDGKYYTLSKAIINNQSFSMNGFANITILINLIFEGVCAKTIQDINFRAFYSTFQYLDDWILINGFNINSDNMKKQKVEYSQPETLEYNINNIFNLNIRFFAYPPPLKITKKEITIKQNIEIELIAENKPLEWFLEKIQALKYLLMFLMNSPTEHLYLKGKLSDSDNVVTVYFRKNNVKLPKKSLGIYDALIPFANIKGRFSEIINIWFSLYNNYRSAFLLFFETIYLLNEKLNLENKFLNIVYSLESYHRKNLTYPSSYIDKELYEKTIYRELTKNIPDNLENDFKESLKSRIKFGYEYSLRRRIKELFRSNNNFINDFIIDAEMLHKEIVETRNYYTHYDEKTEYVRENIDLHNLCEKIKVVIIILFLFELKFSCEEIKKIIKNQELTHRLSNVSGYKHHPGSDTIHSM